MGLFNTTKKLGLTLVGLSYLCAGHAADITTIVSGVINTATTDVSRIATAVIKNPTDAIQIDNGDCGRTFSESSKVFVLVQDMECSGVQGDFSLEFSGHNNHIYLNKHSITAVDLEPNVGILITGDGNHVMGPGIVEGFGATPTRTDGNIVIENASFNHISGLRIQDAIDIGVFIHGIGGRANGNYIHDNIIDASSFEGIRLESESGETDGNYIFHNTIKDTAFSIGLNSKLLGDTANNNFVINNHILRPSFEAIGLFDFGVGEIAKNTIAFNFTEHPQRTPVYCDDAADGINFWGTNFIDMVPEDGFPGPCES